MREVVANLRCVRRTKSNKLEQTINANKDDPKIIKLSYHRCFAEFSLASQRYARKFSADDECQGCLFTAKNGSDDI